jgi:hypothetical protein
MTDPDQIRDDIEQTQRDLSANVDELTGRLKPQRIMNDQVQRARTALGTMKQKVTDTAAQKAAAARSAAAPVVPTAEDSLSSAQGTVSSVTSSAASSAAKAAGAVTASARRGIQANPVAAGLAFTGVSWLLAWILWPSSSAGRRR